MVAQFTHTAPSERLVLRGAGPGVGACGDGSLCPQVVPSPLGDSYRSLRLPWGFKRGPCGRRGGAPDIFWEKQERVSEGGDETRGMAFEAR